MPSADSDVLMLVSSVAESLLRSSDPHRSLPAQSTIFSNERLVTDVSFLLKLQVSTESLNMA